MSRRLFQEYFAGEQELRMEWYNKRQQANKSGWPNGCPTEDNVRNCRRCSSRLKSEVRNGVSKYYIHIYVRVSVSA